MVEFATRPIVTPEAERSPCSDKLDRLGWMASGTYRVGKERVGVRTTSPRFGEWMDRTLRGYEVRGRAGPYLSVVVGDGVREYHILYRGIQPIVRTMHLPTLGRALLAQLEMSNYSKRDDALWVDAALVSGHGALGLIPGYVLPLLVDLGRRVERSGVVLPAHPYVAMDPEDGRVLPARSGLDLPRDPLRALRLLSDRTEPDRFLLERPATVDVVFAVDWSRESGTYPLPRSRAMYEVGSGAMNLERIGSRALGGLQQMVDGAHRALILGLDSRYFLERISAVLRYAGNEGR
jgi:hypothetical protein